MSDEFSYPMGTFSRSVQKRIEHQTGQKLYTEAEHQAEIAALVRKAADCIEIILTKWDADHEEERQRDGYSTGYICGVGEGLRASAEKVRMLLTPPMGSALAEHDSGIRAECNGEWLNMIVRLFGPIPCGGTSLEIAERHLAQVEAKVRADVDTKVVDLRMELQRAAKSVVEISAERDRAETALAEAQKHTEKAEADTDVRWKKKFEQSEAQIVALQGALRFFKENNNIVQHDPMAWHPRYICGACEGVGKEERDHQKDADPNTVQHKPDCPYASATALLEGK